jgi:hypothetical protein
MAAATTLATHAGSGSSASASAAPVPVPAAAAAAAASAVCMRLAWGILMGVSTAAPAAGATAPAGGADAMAARVGEGGGSVFGWDERMPLVLCTTKHPPPQTTPNHHSPKKTKNVRLKLHSLRLHRFPAWQTTRLGWM